MQLRLFITGTVLFFVSITSYCQQVDSLANKLDSLKKKVDTTGQINNTNPENYNINTRITGPVYFTLLVNDFKQQALSPFSTTKKQWLNNAQFVVLAAGLFLADKPVQKWAVNFKENNSWVGPTSNTVTNVGGIYEGVTFAGFAAYGYIAKNEKIRTTTFLASQAYITTTFWETFMKMLSGRARPEYYDPNTHHVDAALHGPFYKLPADSNGVRANSAFPSGHTALAFAAATVYAMEYKNTKVVPIIAYGAASLIGLSRITLNRHWLTDVFIGAGVGILCGQQVVNNYHRYSKLQQGKKRKDTSLTFNLQYNYGHLVPGLVYKF